MTPGERLDRLLRKVVKSALSPTPEAVRLQRLLRDTRKEREGREGRSWWRQLFQLLTSRLPMPAPALAFGVLLIVAQGMTIFNLLPQNSPSEEISRGTRNPCPPTAMLRVIFKPDTPHAGIVSLLRTLEARVVDGPSEIGEIWFEIPREHRALEEALAIVKSSSLADDAVIVATPAAKCP